MNAKAVANEFAKMRHLKIWLFVVLLLVALVGMTLFQAVIGSRILDHLDDPDGFGWKAIFANIGFAVSMVSPLLLAVIASRQVEIEHTGNGWLSSTTASLSPGQLCRAKLISLGVLVVAATLLCGALLMGFGVLVGITAPLDLGRWVGYIGALVVVNLAVLAFQILMSAKIENQLICMALGIFGIFAAIFSQILPAWAAHLTPWGFYALIIPADYVGLDLVYFDLPYLSVLGLAVIGGGLFLFITGRFDRQEA
ncbi:ABC transporter permease [Brachybacterium paraconglomeratum]|uniref:ABC transporter permease n=1 Tax=Brachybacterium TaxID=43668 RepID=UPI000DF2324A|nr:ABC transporter permease [Brachybacterium alimentarium]RCS76490.1 lantibiotic ABC transporter permease [Brachybacterium alimentarium]